MIGDRVRLIGNPQMQQAINARNGMMPNGMPNGVPITNDMKKAMMMGQRGAVYVLVAHVAGAVTKRSQPTRTTPTNAIATPTAASGADGAARTNAA